jgi:ABC-type antimicrobial peptide transport system permease subunit
VNDELNVDKFHERDRQLYQVMKNNYEYQEIETDEDTPGLLARALRQEIPGIESSVSVFPPAAHTFNGILSHSDIKIRAASKFADKDFFRMFSFPVLHGNESTILTEKYGVAISEDVAMKVFNTTDNVVGKTLDWQGERLNGQFVVSGIFETVPSNSSIRFDILFTYDLLLDIFPGFSAWNGSGPSTYVILDENVDPGELNSKIADFVKTKNSESPLTLFVRPYSDRYLYGEYENGMQAGGRIEYVRLLSGVAILIVIIACVNFMNLSTARASRRYKEVGIRKAVGASRRSLVFQYLRESGLTSFVSFLVALLIADLLLPQFNTITGKHLDLRLDGEMALLAVAIVTITGLIAGSYPALYLSNFNPTEIFKSSTGRLNRNSTGEVIGRNGLVVFQFIMSVILIVSVVVLYKQTMFIQSRNLGFSKDNVVTFPVEGKIAGSTDAFLSEIRRLPHVVDASYIDGDLTGMHGGTSAIEWDGKSPEKVVDFEVLQVGVDLIETLGVKVKEGRSFSGTPALEASKIIFNEAAIEEMGLSDPIGKTVRVWGAEKQIIGIVRNFHFESLYEEVKPLFFIVSEKANRNVVVRIEKGKEQTTLADLSSTYQVFNEGLPFEYRFLDEDYQRLYVSEKRMAILAKYFAGLAILISCLGLFGLASFNVERRVKEIGIRKVLGSSALAIVLLLSTNLTRTVFIGIAIALPASYLITRQWLDSFAYRVELEGWFFAIAGVVALVVAWATVATQAVRAARVNPTDCLRDE